MDRDEFVKQLEGWIDSDECENVIEAVLALSDSHIDDEILGLLAAAYNHEGEYKKAIAVLDGQGSRMDGSYKWHFRMGYALYHVSQDKECENDDGLKQRILDRAQAEFARCMNMNPPEDCLEECDMYIDMIESELGEEDEDDDIGENAELYDEDEAETIEEHIREHFGDFPTILHEIHSPDIHIDICIVPPTEERNYYTLVTIGMGAHIMNLPKNLPKEEYGRAELLVCLPPNWKVGENDEEWFWPIALLKNLARLPINSDTWLGLAHSADNRFPYSDNTELCGAVLVSPEDVSADAGSCELPNGDMVNFYEIIPLYHEEIQYKLDNGSDEFRSIMSGVSHVVDINRPNRCKNYPFAAEYMSDLIVDSNHSYVRTIRTKELQTDELNACSHLAAFLRWFIEKGLCSSSFLECYGDIAQGVLDGSHTDIREDIRKKFGGAIYCDFFTYEGLQFARYCYDPENEERFFPSEVDKYAEEYFGAERCESGEFQDEAFLFLPFDENYYERLKSALDKWYKVFRAEFDKEQEAINDSYAEKMTVLLGCRCECFYPGHPEQIREALEEARRKGMENQYTPMLIVCDGSGMIESWDYADGLSEMLGEELSSPLTIAHIPVKRAKDIKSVLIKRFSAKECDMAASEELEAIKKKMFEKYGEVPAVISLEDSLDMTVFFPEKYGFSCYLISKAREDAELGEKNFPWLARGNSESELAPAMMHFLDCKCRLFEPTEDDTEIVRAYRKAQDSSKEEGFVPVMITVDDRLLQRLIFNSSALDSGGAYDFDLGALRDYRAKSARRKVRDGRRMLREWAAENSSSDRSFEDLFNEPLNRFLGYWDYSTKKTNPVILAEIPVKNPWEVFSYLPFGGFNGCPDSSELMAVTKYWNEKHGAVPAVITSNTLEFDIPRQIESGAENTLLSEMSGFCEDIVHYSEEYPQSAVKNLRNSSVWYFRWD
jgi:hypothetical protein